MGHAPNWGIAFRTSIVKQLTDDGSHHLPAHVPEKFQAKTKLTKQTTIGDLENTHLNPKTEGRIRLLNPQVSPKLLSFVLEFHYLLIWFPFLFLFLVPFRFSSVLLFLPTSKNDSNMIEISQCITKLGIDWVEEEEGIRPFGIGHCWRIWRRRQSTMN